MAVVGMGSLLVPRVLTGTPLLPCHPACLKLSELWVRVSLSTVSMLPPVRAESKRHYPLDGGSSFDLFVQFPKLSSTHLSLDVFLGQAKVVSQNCRRRG